MVTLTTNYRDDFFLVLSGTMYLGFEYSSLYFTGLPFFVSAAAWYCKLCNQWMGDLHCASAHLKSDIHEAKFAVSDLKFEII